jgi:precorrin-6B methylase 2
MWGPKKIFAKIMNGKLIIRVGGGFMLIDEFLRHYETELKGSNQLVINVMEENGTMSQRPLDAVRSATPTKSNIFINSYL